jgi:hypothetical protein
MLLQFPYESQRAARGVAAVASAALKPISSIPDFNFRWREGKPPNNRKLPSISSSSACGGSSETLGVN